MSNETFRATIVFALIMYMLAFTYTVLMMFLLSELYDEMERQSPMKTFLRKLWKAIYVLGMGWS